MRKAAALVGLLVVACSQPAQHAAVSPTSAVSPTQASPTPGQSPDTTPSPTPGDLPLSQVSFSCRLPISYSTSIGTYPSESAFISFPSTAKAIDPAGKGAGYFDRAFSRWLPVTREAVSPDGKHYAYLSFGDQGIFFVHVVDVATGTDHAFREDANAVAITFTPSVLDFAAEGIYLLHGFERVMPGMWLVDPNTGAIRLVSDAGGIQVSGGGGIFWIGDINPADPHPVNTASSSGTLPDQIDRLDLKTGSLTPWLYMPGYGLRVLGVDSQARPLIGAVLGIIAPAPHSDPIDHSASELLLALGADSQRSIDKGAVVDALVGGIADAHGFWFGSLQGLYFYSDASGLQKVSNQPGFPANGCF